MKIRRGSRSHYSCHEISPRCWRIWQRVHTRTTGTISSTIHKPGTLCMVADFNETLLENFLIGQYALWAGDYQNGMELFSRVAEGMRDGRGLDRHLEDIRNSNVLLQVAAQRRLNQLERRQQEFEAIRDSLPSPDNLATCTPT